MRYTLNGGGSGSDASHPLVFQFVQTSSGISTGVVIVPAAGVESVPFEFLDPRNSRQFRLVERTARHDHEARRERIAAIGGDGPAGGIIVPTRFLDRRLEAGFFV